MDTKLRYDSERLHAAADLYCKLAAQAWLKKSPDFDYLLEQADCLRRLAIDHEDPYA